MDCSGPAADPKRHGSSSCDWPNGIGCRHQSPLMCSGKAEHRPGRTFGRRGSGDHDARIQKQPHGCSRRRRMSASSSAIQRAISSAENMRVSGSAAPSARSREARKSINSCFSAGESETAAASMSASVTIRSASVTIRTSVHALRAVCKVHVPCPRAHAPNHFHQRTASWFNRLRSRSPAPRRHDRWGDAGAGVHLPRPFAEHRSGTGRELMRPPADWNVSRFLSRVPADDRVYADNTAVVMHPTRGAFLAGSRTGSRRAA